MKIYNTVATSDKDNGSGGWQDIVGVLAGHQKRKKSDETIDYVYTFSYTVQYTEKRVHMIMAAILEVTGGHYSPLPISFVFIEEP